MFLAGKFTAKSHCIQKDRRWERQNRQLDYSLLDNVTYTQFYRKNSLTFLRAVTAVLKGSYFANVVFGVVANTFVGQLSKESSKHAQHLFARTEPEKKSTQTCYNGVTGRLEIVLTFDSFTTPLHSLNTLTERPDFSAAQNLRLANTLVNRNLLYLLTKLLDK